MTRGRNRSSPVLRLPRRACAPSGGPGHEAGDGPGEGGHLARAGHHDLVDVFAAGGSRPVPLTVGDVPPLIRWVVVGWPGPSATRPSPRRGCGRGHRRPGVQGHAPRAIDPDCEIQVPLRSPGDDDRLTQYGQITLDEPIAWEPGWLVPTASEPLRGGRDGRVAEVRSRHRSCSVYIVLSLIVIAGRGRTRSPCNTELCDQTLRICIDRPPWPPSGTVSVMLPALDVPHVRFVHANCGGRSRRAGHQADHRG